MRPLSFFVAVMVSGVSLSGCRQALPIATVVYQAAAPSIVFVRTPASTGSGIVLANGVIITNAHVVWPYAEARVSFHDGTVIPSVVVSAVDVDADLAVLGPIQHDGPVLSLAEDAEATPIGSPVFLVGYPGEVEDLPKPTITAGVLSRVREARFADLTFLQADATIVGGQSGGALLDSAGRVLGVSGLMGIGERNFALVLSSQDVTARVAELMKKPTQFLRGTVGPPALTHKLHLQGPWSQRSFVVDLAEEQEIDVSWKGDEAEVKLYNPNNDVVDLNANTYVAGVEGPHFVLVAGVDDKANGVLTSNVPLRAIEDVDDERHVTLGSMVSGAIDFPSDIDRYSVFLAKGDRIRVRVDGVLESRAGIDFEVSSDEPLAGSLPAEGGLGMGAEVIFTAPKAGKYIIAVDEAQPEGPAGYQLWVGPARKPAQAAETKSMYGTLPRSAEKAGK